MMTTLKVLTLAISVLLVLAFIFGGWFLWALSKEPPQSSNHEFEIVKKKVELPPVQFPEVPKCEHCKG